MSSVKESIIVGCVLLALLAIVAHCTEACKPAKDPVPGYCTAEGLFTAAVLRCTDKSPTRAESQACKRDLQRSCGFSETVADGGAK